VKSRFLLRYPDNRSEQLEGEKIMPIWNKIQISDKAVEIAAKINGIPEEEAFDRLLELLENASFSKFKGIDQGMEQYRLENEYLYVKDQILVHYSQRKYYSKKLRLALHQAEDGRCEKCGRPMDKQAVCVQRKDESVFNDFNNYVLLCPDCDNGKPDVLNQATFAEETIIRYQEARNITFEEAQEELLSTKNNLVLINFIKGNRHYWAPKLGIFILVDNVLKLVQLENDPMPVIERKPQARSRRWTVVDQEVAASIENR
jgi:hypothetical protein